MQFPSLILDASNTMKEVTGTSAMNSAQQITPKFCLNSTQNKLKNKGRKAEEEKLVSTMQIYQAFRYIKRYFSAHF